MIIRIDSSIRSILPDFTVLAMSMEVECENSQKIAPLIASIEHKIKEEYSLEDVLNIPLIKEARDSYKKLGKDPSRYRLAVESLIRRLVKGNQLYQISNIVDAGNVLSIQTMRSVCVVDYDKIQGDVTIRIGALDDGFEGIGRGLLNVSNIPVYVDEVGPFGSSTSDTPRTMITEATEKIMIMIICFSKDRLVEHRRIAKEIFEEFCYAKNITNLDVKGCE